MPGRLLLIDDDSEVHSLLGGCLAKEPWDLAHATSGADGLRLAWSKPPDLILLDLGLPDADGFEILAQLKADARSEALPVIVLTGWNSTADKLRAFDLGATDYVTKPFEMRELRARLRAVLRAKQLQDQLAHANEQLVLARVAAEGANRAKSEFLANVSHEIRTPLNGVIATAGLVLDSPLNAEQRELVNTMRQSGEALLAIINDLLDFSKIESGRLELERRPFEVRASVQEVLDLFAAKAGERRLELAWFVEDRVPPVVVGDGNRVRQVLANLVSNAIKFTSRGEVVVEVGLGSPPGLADAPAAAPAAAGGEALNRLHFRVRDTGIGIAAGKMARLFQPFVQADASTSREYGGTGLGLAISANLVRLMGGRLWGDSEERRGSTFHVVLDLPSGPPPETASPAPDAGVLSGRRLLIVEDHPTTCRWLAALARRWGMTARTAARAGEALAWLEAGNTFDIALLDFDLPDVDGPGLAWRIRSLPGLAEQPLLLLAAVGHPAVRIDAPAPAPFGAFITKPVRPAQLQQALLEALEGPMAALPPSPARALLGPSLASRLPLRVLLVDDNTVNQQVGLRLLRKLGYEADLAQDGFEAIKAAEASRYDLLLMDVQMPELDGLETTRRLRGRERDRAPAAGADSPLCIVAMTANAMQGDRERCLAAGMDDYLSKPVRLEDLRALLERWAARLGGRSGGGDAGESVPPPAAPAVAPALEGDFPVDLERLREMAGDDGDGMRELVELYVRQAEDQCGRIEAALSAGETEGLRRTAHSWAGSSATCGMRSLASLLRELERLGERSELGPAADLWGRARREHDRVRQFLEVHVPSATPQPH
jgi:CheY-like chemotaxis protein/nitrogen-specific signal transduction histidine kinase/HPt (histidine-containing phosphotransfer) domain-containing protein